LQGAFDRAREKLDSDRSSTIWEKFDNMISDLSQSAGKSLDQSMKEITELGTTVSSGLSMMRYLITKSPSILYISQVLYNTIFMAPINLVTSLELLVGIPLPLLIFGSIAILLLLGTMWNIISYMSCIKTTCDIKGTEYIELMNKICTEQCWDLGVSGLSELLLPDDILNSLQEYGAPVSNIISVYNKYKSTIQDWQTTREKARYVVSYSHLIAESYR
jgi:hypothetical protein